MRRASLLGALLVCGLQPAAAAGMPVADGETSLSPRLEALASPEVRSAPRAAQAKRLGLPPTGPGSLLRSGQLVFVDVRFDSGAAAGVEELQDAGATVIDLSTRYQTVTVAAKPAELEALAEAPGVGGVTEVLAPTVRGPDCGGSVRSEGDAQLQATGARNKWGVDGTGVTVGVLSDSFDRAAGALTHASGDVATGDLPGPGSPCGSTEPVGIVNDPFVETDEGRAMAQIVRDLAPGAAIDFATAFGSETFFAANIKALANGGAKVIVDDVGYPGEPFFQDGPIAQAINEVTSAGVSYFSAAGNDNLFDELGREIGSWEAPAYRDSGTCPPAIVTLSEELELAEEEAELEPEGLNPSHCMDFDPTLLGEDQAFAITVESGRTLRVDQQWAEPWFGVGTDLDAFLLDEAGNLLEPEVEGEPVPVVSLEDNIGVSQKPFEFLSWKNTGPEQQVQLVINRFAGGEPRLKLALLQNGGGVTAIEYPEPTEGDAAGPTIFGHAGAQSAISVGAVRFDQTEEPESFSSRGPVRHFFGPVTGPAPASPSEAVISKPDLVASDGVANTFFGPFESGARRFYGTSAAAPHAAAVAALVRQANPGASAGQVRADLTGTAQPVGPFGPDAVGAGLIDADAAVDLLALPPQITVTRAPAPLSRERRPTIEFTASRPVTFACAIDGGAPQPCASPFAVPAELADGEHGIAVSGTDLGGRIGSSGTLFRIDTTAPTTIISAHPPKLVRTRHRRARGVFRFGSDEAAVSFTCRVDREPWKSCGARLGRRYLPGKHVMRARAQDVAGNADATPALFRFRVKRIDR